jgi:hypothetical protein
MEKGTFCGGLFSQLLIGFPYDDLDTIYGTDGEAAEDCAY